LKPELPSRLIESILLKIPIPPIYFGKAPQGHLEVIDGQQRLTTLMRFVGNEFALRKLHSMSSLNGKFFKDLTTQEQEKILDEPIRTIVIDAADNTELRYEIFERLNRGSMALNEQEIRNCVYRGPFNELLAELEKEANWRKMKGGQAPEQRFKEREMILRFFAFANRLQQYTGKLKHFLNEYMQQFAPKEPQQLKAHTAQFRQTTQNIYAVFGDKAGRLYDVNSRTNKGQWDSKFSVTVFDIQASALMNRPTAKVQQAAEQIRELFLFTMLTDNDLQDAISRRTGSTLQSKVRWTKFRELVDPIIDGTLIEPRFFDLSFRRELFDKSPICSLCNNQIHSFEDSTVDHIIPYTKGGKTIPGNAQLAHRGCNARKNAQPPDTNPTPGAPPSV
jgi:5-methylcytosine-specific restriction endonuclease McrA